MSTMRRVTSGFERLITRSLAIVAIAVAAGVTHSWLHGQLEPEGRQPVNTGAGRPAGSPAGPVVEPGENDVETPGGDVGGEPGGDEVEPGGGDSGEPGDAQQTPNPDPGAAALPEGHISLEDAYTHWTNASAVFIDARPKGEFEAGHIQGALNLSLEMTRDADRYAAVAAWLDSELPIILYCRGGLCSEAKDVGRLLKGAGYQNTLILDAGFPGWQEAGYSVATGPEQ